MSATSLQEGLKRAASKKESAPARQRATPKKEGKPSRQSSREGTVLIAGHFDVSVKQRLLAIRAEHPERTQQDLLMEALNYLFHRYNQPLIER